MTETENRLLELLKDLIMIQSVEDNPSGLLQAVSLIRYHIDNIPGIRIEEHQCEGKPSLVARPDNDAPIDVMLVGHVDVVEAEPELFLPRVDGNRVYGRGAGDMKGQVAVITEIFKEIMLENPETPLGLMITADEESGGFKGVGHLASQERYRCNAAVLPDSGSLNEIVQLEKGILSGRIVCTGVSGHSSRPWESDNAVERLLKILESLKETFDALENTADNWRHTLSVNILSARNNSANRIPDHAEAVIDVRFTEKETIESMTAMVVKHLDEKSKFIPQHVEPPLIAKPDPLFLKVTEKLTGKPAKLIRAHGGSDGGFFTQNGTSVIMSRPNVGGLHSSCEWIEIDSMFKYYEILGEYIKKRCRL